MDDLDTRLKDALSRRCPLPDDLRRATLMELRKPRPARSLKPILVLAVLSAAAGLMEMLLLALWLSPSALLVAVMVYGAAVMAASLGVMAYWTIPGLRDGPAFGKE